MHTNKIFIIAEAGVNHNGDIQVAKKMVEAAAKSGADAVKFQTFKAENLVTQNVSKANYQQNPADIDQTQYGMLKRLELNDDMHKTLITHCKKNNILFLSSPFDVEGVAYLNQLDMPLFKIPSGEITNLPFLKKIGACNKPIIISTGMARLSEIRDAVDVLVSSGADLKTITILHCNTEYPTPMQDVNLLAMKTIESTFPDCRVGYSDHTTGVEIAIAAAALGARVIEKHFTLDKTWDGPDHMASLEPDELTRMIEGIRNIEIALGNGIKAPSPSESPNIAIARKAIVAARDINKGTVFTESNITTKRAGEGLSPMLWDDIIGAKAKRDFKIDECIEL